MHIQCVFYSFCNKYVCFVICENYFLFFTRFKKVHFLESQSTRVAFCCPISFSNATPFMFLFFVFSTPYTITVFSFYTFWFFFLIENNIYHTQKKCYEVGKMFLTIYFIRFYFVELWFSNFLSNNLFETSSINDFLVDSSVCFLFILLM